MGTPFELKSTFVFYPASPNSQREAGSRFSMGELEAGVYPCGRRISSFQFVRFMARKPEDLAVRGLVFLTPTISVKHSEHLAWNQHVHPLNRVGFSRKTLTKFI